MNRTPPPQGPRRRDDSAVPRHLPLLVSMGLLCIGLVASVRSVVWHGAPFPGFFLMPNRVVPSAGLPTWSGVADGRAPYQEVLLAVDGMPVATGADGYRRAATHHAGEPVQYLFARRDGTETRTYPLRVFSLLRLSVSCFPVLIIVSLLPLLPGNGRSMVTRSASSTRSRRSPKRSRS